MSDVTDNFDFSNYAPRTAANRNQPDATPVAEAPFRQFAECLYMTIMASGACLAHITRGTRRRINNGINSLFVAWAIAGVGWGVVLGFLTWPLYNTVLHPFMTSLLG